MEEPNGHNRNPDSSGRRTDDGGSKRELARLRHALVGYVLPFVSVVTMFALFMDYMGRPISAVLVSFIVAVLSWFALMLGIARRNGSG